MSNVRVDRQDNETSEPMIVMVSLIIAMTIIIISLTVALVIVVKEQRLQIAALPDLVPKFISCDSVNGKITHSNFDLYDGNQASAITIGAEKNKGDK